MGMERVVFIFSIHRQICVQVPITKTAMYSLLLKVEMSIQKISPVLSNAMDVGSNLSESGKILSKYLELDMQVKVN